MSTRLLTEPELVASAHQLAATLPQGAVVCLEGNLGAGKTTFARALLAGLGVPEAATSPTYALVHRHEAPGGPVYHLDCYRLKSPDEAADLDWDGIQREARALVVEWPERAGGWVPPAHVTVRLRHVDDPAVRAVEGA